MTITISKAANLCSKILCAVFVMFFLIPGVSANAQFADPSECTTKSIDIEDIFVTTSFTPLIDEGCGTTEDGRAQPLSLAVLPSILIRGYGFLASIVFYFFGVTLLVSGLRYIYGGISDDAYRNVIDARKSIGTSLLALGLVLGAYLIVFTVLQVLGIQSLGTTDVSSFFTF